MPVAHDVVILEGARTPIGSFLGGLASVSATELGAVAARGALARAGVDASSVDAVFFGNVIQSSKDAAYLARHVGLDAGAPVGTPALTVNRACASGMEAVVQAAKALMVGEAATVLAGGAENMSMTPYAMRGARQGWPMMAADVDDVLFSALHDPKAGCSIGETVEHLASLCGVDRQAADRAAVEGQRRAAAALADGVLAEQIVPVELRDRRGRVSVVAVDEAPRPDTTLDGLARLRGLYAKDGVVTAGNSTGLNDGAAAVIVTSGARARAEGLAPIGRVVSWGTVGVAPLEMGLGPVEASRQALAAAGMTVGDYDLVELNDSFAVQYLAVAERLDLDPATVNVHGGAIALGHPMGATGTRLLLAALYGLRRRGGGRALCTVCVGGGQGMAVVVESVG